MKRSDRLELLQEDTDVYYHLYVRFCNKYPSPIAFSLIFNMMETDFDMGYEDTKRIKEWN